MLGSASDAEDAVQDTLLRAWSHQEHLRDMGAQRAWLYRIATRVCLDMVRTRKRPVLAPEVLAPGSAQSALELGAEYRWIEPMADACVIPDDATPEQRIIQRETLRLAFMTALQALSPSERAALVLCEVFDFSAKEIAETLDTTVAAVNSALQRSRIKVRSLESGAPPQPEVHARLVQSLIEALERFDIDAVVALLAKDVTFTMPPYSLWLHGARDVREWLSVGPGAACRGCRVFPIEMSGTVGIVQYKRADERAYRAWAFAVLESHDSRLHGWHSYLDTDSLCRIFGVPAEISR